MFLNISNFAWSLPQTTGLLFIEMCLCLKVRLCAQLEKMASGMSCVYHVTGVAIIVVKDCVSFSLWTGAILVKGSTDTISNTAAQHCKVQPRKPWDMISLLGSFIGGSHGRVEAQETDPDFFAGRKRSICGGQCGDQVKPPGL